jgi:hypothetical protein
LIPGGAAGKLNLMVNLFILPKISSLRLLLSLMIIAAALSGCLNQDPLLGTWQEPSSSVVMELKEDGTLVMSLGNSSFSMKYTLKEPDEITLIASSDSNIPDTKMTYRLEDEKLILTLDGVETVFLRVD